MSFVRFGQEGSGVYIFEQSDGSKVCCMCVFTPTDAEGRNLRPDFYTHDLDAVLAHLAEHRAAGHVVPEWVDHALRDEWDGDDLR